MQNKQNNRGVLHLLISFNLGSEVLVEGRDDGIFLHDAADIIITYLFEAVDDSRQACRILSNDSNIFVLLVY